MIYIEFIYILDSNNYLNYYKNGRVKFLPEFLIPKLKPQIIEEIKISDNIVGRIVGINLKSMNLLNESCCMSFIEAINKVKTTECKLFMEGMENIEAKILEEIRLGTNTCLFSGQDIKDFNIIPIIKMILNKIKEPFDSREILLLCDSKVIIKSMLKSLGKDFKFITVFGCEKDYDEIYEYILEETGISIFYSYKLPKIIDKYNIIINYMDDIDFEVSKIRRNAIVFDFNHNKPIAGKRKATISDFGFDFKSLNIKSDFVFENIINTQMFEIIINNQHKIADYIYSYGEYHLIKDYIEEFLKIKIDM